MLEEKWETYISFSTLDENKKDGLTKHRLSLVPQSIMFKGTSILMAKLLKEEAVRKVDSSLYACFYLQITIKSVQGWR